MKTVIRRCSKCGRRKEVKVGLHNIKELFRRPTSEDLIILAIVFLLVFSAWGYSRDMDVCHETAEVLTEKVNELEQGCQDYCSPNITEEYSFNLSAFS